MTFDVFPGDGRLPVVLSCEHASGNIPDEFDDLGMAADHLAECASGQDVGAAELFDALIAELCCAGIRNGVSRLVIDANRYEDQAELIPTRWGGREIGGNLALTDEARFDRIVRYHRPYHAALHELLVACEARHEVAFYFAIHAMAPTFEGAERTMDFALIATAGLRIATDLAASFRGAGYKATINDPYRLDRDVIRVTAGHEMERFNIRAVLIEINERLCGDPEARSALTAAIRNVVEQSGPPAS